MMPNNKSKLGILVCQLVARMEQGNDKYSDLLAKYLTRKDNVKVVRYLHDTVSYPEIEGEWED